MTQISETTYKKREPSAVWSGSALFAINILQGLYIVRLREGIDPDRTTQGLHSRVYILGSTLLAYAISSHFLVVSLWLKLIYLALNWEIAKIHLETPFK